MVRTSENRRIKPHLSSYDTWDMSQSHTLSAPAYLTANSYSCFDRDLFILEHGLLLWSHSNLGFTLSAYTWRETALCPGASWSIMSAGQRTTDIEENLFSRCRLCYALYQKQSTVWLFSTFYLLHSKTNLKIIFHFLLDVENQISHNQHKSILYRKSPSSNIKLNKFIHKPISKCLCCCPITCKQGRKAFYTTHSICFEDASPHLRSRIFTYKSI